MIWEAPVVNESARDLKDEACRAIPETAVRDPVKEREREACSLRPDTAVHEIASDRSREMWARIFEDEESEALKVLPMALA